MQYVMQDISQDSVGLVSNLFIILEVWPNDHITVMYILLYSSLWLEIHFLVIQNKWITHIKLSQVYSVNVSVYVEYVMLWRFTPCVLCGIRTETVQRSWRVFIQRSWRSYSWTSAVRSRSLRRFSLWPLTWTTRRKVRDVWLIEDGEFKGHSGGPDHLMENGDILVLFIHC